MQINVANTNIPLHTQTKYGNSYKKNRNINSTTPLSNNIAFKGGFGAIKNWLDSMSLGVANAIEYGGLAISFILQDTLGTNLPRPIMGLKRNQDKNEGKANTSFAAKEIVREFTTGPSMFLIPMGMLALAKRFLGATYKIPSKLTKAFGDIHVKNAIQNKQIATNDDFFKSTFAEIIKNAKGETNITRETQKIAENFAKELSTALKNPETHKLGETIELLSKQFINISKAHAKDAVYSDFTFAKVSDNAGGSFKKVVSSMISYSDDIVNKSQNQSINEIQNFIKNSVSKSVVGRFILNSAMYASVIGFLQVIPKLYNKAEGDKNAGLVGLVNEDKAPNKTNTPSFGSLAGMAKNISGNGKFGKFADMIEFDGCSMSFTPLLGLMGMGIMYPRLKNAKDDYDREEILRRDAVTCVVMCFAEKTLRKCFSIMNEAASGLVLAVKDEQHKNKGILGRIFDYLRPVNGVGILSSDQIRAKYSNIEQYKDGIKGFCDFISGQGGDLKKVFSLTEASKKIVLELLEDEGKTLEKADNKTITEVLDKAKNSQKVKRLSGLFYESKLVPIKKQTILDKIMNRTYIMEDNEWVKKARTLNARFTALSVIVLVPVFLGFLLPEINERATKKRISEEQSLLSKQNRNTSLNNNTYQVSKVFEDIAKRTV